MKLTNEKLLDLLNRVDSALERRPRPPQRLEADKLEELRREVADAAFTLEREPC